MNVYYITVYHMNVYYITVYHMNVYYITVYHMNVYYITVYHMNVYYITVYHMNVYSFRGSQPYPRRLHLVSGSFGEKCWPISCWIRLTVAAHRKWCVTSHYDEGHVGEARHRVGRRCVWQHFCHSVLNRLRGRWGRPHPHFLSVKFVSKSHIVCLVTVLLPSYCIVA